MNFLAKLDLVFFLVAFIRKPTRAR